MLTRYEQFAFMISDIYRYIQKIERDEMVRHGYKGAYAQYLAAISRHPEGLTSAQLCEVCDKNKAAVSRIIAEMEEKDLVIREGASYRACIKLTSKGEEVAQFVFDRALVAVDAVGKDLTDETREILYASLRTISANLQAVSKEGIPRE